jgi:hypothetical protein
MVVIWVSSIVFERAHDPARLKIAADTLEHGLIALGLVMLASAALPRAHLLLVGLGVLGLGVSLELLQMTKLVPGGFEVRDILANLMGVALGVLAVGIGEVRAGQTRDLQGPEASEPSELRE